MKCSLPQRLLFIVTRPPPFSSPLDVRRTLKFFFAYHNTIHSQCHYFQFKFKILKPHANRRSSLLPDNSQHCWMLHIASVCTPCWILVHVVGSCCICLHTNATEMQQHATLLWRQCWELLCPFAPSFWQMETTHYKLELGVTFTLRSNIKSSYMKYDHQ